MTFRMLTAGVVCGALMLPLAAYAQSGATGGAVAGAIGGAVVAGPVGAVVGGGTAAGEAHALASRVKAMSEASPGSLIIFSSTIEPEFNVPVLYIDCSANTRG